MWAGDEFVEYKRAGHPPVKDETPQGQNLNPEWTCRSSIRVWARDDLVKCKRVGHLPRFAGRCVVVCLLAVSVGGIFGCQDSDTTLEAEARSPYGPWVASAFTTEHGGPGNAGLYTEVYLRRTDLRQAPTEILGFSLGGLASAALNLTMKWQSPSRLEVTYNGRAATLYFQVVKCAGIDILTRDVSDQINYEHE